MAGIIAYPYEITKWVVRGTEVVARRSDLDVTASEVARRARISKSYMCKIESHRETTVSYAVLCRLMGALELEMSPGEQAVTFTKQ